MPSGPDADSAAAATPDPAADAPTRGERAGPRLLPCGESAVLIEVTDTAAAIDLARRIEVLRSHPASARPLVEDIVAGQRTVLVTAPGAAVLSDLRRAVTELVWAPMGSGDSRAAWPGEQALVEIPVGYAGPDLDVVAAHTGLTRDEVVAAHTGTDWVVGFTGFAPGFGYLVGGDPRLVVPRRAEPRPRVAAGSVALAGPYSGIYPTESPGGWQIIGHTGAVLWDLHRDPPALLRPGLRVRFVEAGGPS